MTVPHAFPSLATKQVEPGGTEEKPGGGQETETAGGAGVMGVTGQDIIGLLPLLVSTPDDLSTLRMMLQGQNPDGGIPEGDFMSEAKDWAGELISGQTGTGRILVRRRGQGGRSGG